MVGLPNLNRFEIRHILGRGGVGDVYAALDRQRGEEVALKLVRLTTADKEMLDSERDGVRLQKELGDTIPYVVKVYDFNEEDGFFWVSMEYVEGKDLAAELNEGPLPEGRAVRIAIQLCDLLDRFQRFISNSGGRKHLGIVHGDLKPENLRLQAGDKVRVLDFGIAKPLSVSRAYTRSSFGSLPYLPPERLRSGTVDSNSDSWAVGIILYFMLSGRLPFAGSIPEEVERQILCGEVTSLPTSFSRSLQWIVYRSLAYEPAQRYPTAAAMKVDLEAVLSENSHNRPDEHAVEEAIHRVRPQAIATQRTVPGKGTETRRTIQAKPAVLSDRTSISSSSFRHKKSRVRGRLLLPLTLIPLVLFASCQTYVWHSARQIQQELSTAPISEIDALWQRYKRIDQLSLFGFGLNALRPTMKNALWRAAEPILASYRGDDPKSMPKDWEKARQYFAAALEVDGTDLKSQARLAYCRGHLALVDAGKLDDLGESEAARSKDAEAISEFEQAARLDNEWPDPFIGLGRIFVYRQFDLKKLEEALKEAQTRGFSEPRRLKAWLAEGYQKEGRRVYKQSLDVRGSLRESDLLFDAIRNLDRAISLYDEIPGYARSERNRNEAAQQRRTVENRLATLGYR
jgi:serine/threonine protein kinase